MKTTIISDFCCNHLGQTELIKEGIKQLGDIGVDYIKFQVFNADNLNPNYPNYDVMYSHYKKTQIDNDKISIILQLCKDNNIKPLFTAFDIDSARLLRQFGINIVKIASPDADNFELLEYCDRNFDHLIISCGMISTNNLIKIRSLYKRHSFLYCVSKYPTAINDVDFDKMILYDGFSDHTADLTASKKAIDIGVPIVERHFTLGKYLPGKDHLISSTPDEFAELVKHRDYVASFEKYKNRWRSL